VTFPYAAEAGRFFFRGFFEPGFPLFFAISKLRPRFDPPPTGAKRSPPAAPSNTAIAKYVFIEKTSTA
jgi:hypothetical protein